MSRDRIPVGDIEYRCKVAVLGVEYWDGWKDSIDDFVGDDYIATFGFIESSKQMKVLGYRVNLHLFLLSSRDYFKKSTGMHILGAEGAILICDPKNGKSMRMVSGWCELLRERCGEIPIVVIGNIITDGGDTDKGVLSAKLRWLERDIGDKYRISAFMELLLKDSANEEKMWEEIVRIMVQRW